MLMKNNTEFGMPGISLVAGRVVDDARSLAQVGSHHHHLPTAAVAVAVACPPPYSFLF